MNNNLCTGFDSPLDLSRRKFFANFGMGLGGMALADLMTPGGTAAAATSSGQSPIGMHLPAKAKRVIYLFQSGGPSQLDLFDHKPRLNVEHAQELPDSVRNGQRLTGMSTNQSSFPLAGSHLNSTVRAAPPSAS